MFYNDLKFDVVDKKNMTMTIGIRSRTSIIS